MTQESYSTRANLGRGGVMVAGNGDTSFVDYANLHPINEVAAVLSGTGGGALLGGVGAMLAATHNLGENGAPRFNLLVTSALVAVPAVLGGIVGFLQAQTHNKWSNRMLDHMETQRQNAADGQINR